MTKSNVKQFKRTPVTAALKGLFQNAGIAIKDDRQTWSLVDGLYQSIGEAIIEIGMGVNSAIQTCKQLNYEGDNELISTIASVKSDLESFTSDLIKINSRHRGSQGFIETEDDVALCIGVHCDYITLNERFKALTFPAMLTITEHLTTAALRANAKPAPEGVTDVEFKEVSHAAA